MEMEIVNETEAEIRNGGLGADPGVAFELNSNVNKENEVLDSSADALQENNGAADDPLSAAEGLNSSGDGESAAAVASESKDSTVLKVCLLSVVLVLLQSLNCEDCVINMKHILCRKVRFQRFKRAKGVVMRRPG